MKNVKLILTLAAVAATMALGGCGGFYSVKRADAFKDTSGYASIYEKWNGYPYKCKAVEPESVCANRSGYVEYAALIEHHFNGPDLSVIMLIPKDVKIHSGDIVRFSNARMTARLVLSAQFDGIARKYDKTNSTCQYDESHDWCGKCGVTRCNGWDGHKFDMRTPEVFGD